MKGRSSIALIAIVVVLGLASVYTYFGHIAPLQQKVQATQNEMSAKQVFLTSTARNEKKAKTVSTAPVVDLPKTADVSPFLEDFNQLLEKNKVTLQNMAEVDKTTATDLQDSVNALSYTVKVIGKSDTSMLAFIHQLEQLPRFVTLDTLEITHQGKETHATFNLTLYWEK